MLSFLINRIRLTPKKHREYWLHTMFRIVDPVLNCLSKGILKRSLPNINPQRQPYAPLEAFGRVACGIAPWLELNDLVEGERVLQLKYLKLFHNALDMATDPNSPDYMVFNADDKSSRQPLVDAAFLSLALLRAPSRIVQQMDNRVKKNLIHAFELSRKIQPLTSNWVLFAAMVESGLCILGAKTDYARINKYIRMMMEWYKGDGVYGDGPNFRYDYYNSFVIHPMLVDLTKYHHDKYGDIESIVLKRAQRYAAIQERLISPDGYYPITGRSICYRFGAFHLLAQASLQHFLPDFIQPPQVRCALTNVIKTSIASPNTFDESGWLRPGIYGYQPNLAEKYINTGSLYLCSTIFLPLGLPVSDEFWSAPNHKWTSQKITSGENMDADKGLNE